MSSYTWQPGTSTFSHLAQLAPSRRIFSNLSSCDTGLPLSYYKKEEGRGKDKGGEMPFGNSEVKGSEPWKLATHVGGGW